MGTCRNDKDPNPGRLPQTEWEVLDQRKSIPADLQSLIGAPTSVIRVPMSVHEKISTKHANVLADYSMLGQHLETWQAYRIVNHRWEIYMPERDDGDRLMAIIGVDKPVPSILFRCIWCGGGTGRIDPSFLEKLGVEQWTSAEHAGTRVS